MVVGHGAHVKNEIGAKVGFGFLKLRYPFGFGLRCPLYAIDMKMLSLYDREACETSFRYIVPFSFIAFLLCPLCGRVVLLEWCKRAVLFSFSANSLFLFVYTRYTRASHCV